MPAGKNRTQLPPGWKIVEDETVSSSQETLPIPIWAGKRAIAARQATRIYNTTAKEAPSEMPGKK